MDLADTPSSLTRREKLPIQAIAASIASVFASVIVWLITPVSALSLLIIGLAAVTVLALLTLLLAIRFLRVDDHEDQVAGYAITWVSDSYGRTGITAVSPDEAAKQIAKNRELRDGWNAAHDELSTVYDILGPPPLTTMSGSRRVH
jgi:hypothetical protein